MAIPQDWMPPGMPDEQKDEIAAKHPDDPYAAAAEAWATWANDMPIEEQGVKSISTGSQSITYEGGGPYDAAMERARWFKSRSKTASSLDVGGKYKWGYNAPTRWGIESEAGEGDPALPNGEPWGSYTVTTADVVLTNGTGPLTRSNFQTQEDANNELVQQIASKADADHVHTDDGGAVDLTDYETKADASAAHNTLDQSINTGLAGKADKDHDHTIDLDGYVTKDEANEAHQELDRKIDAAAAGDHTHSDYETKAQAQAAHDTLSGRITQVSQDKADTGHGHIDLETKIQAQESHQDLQDQIDDRALASHTHAEYANPDLSAYETKVASQQRDNDLENQIKGKAATDHTHPEVQPPDLSGLVTDSEFAADQRRQDLALTEGLAEKSEKSHVHDGADGGPQYELEKDAVQRYERTALELSTKADKDHDHPSGDHQHDDLATSKELQTETALRKQGDEDLQKQINNAVAGGHNHDQDYASKTHGHGEFSLSGHTHPEYEGGGGSSDVTKAYVDAQDADEAKARSEADKALGERIDNIEHPTYDDSELRDAIDLKFDKAGGDLSSGGAKIGVNRIGPIAGTANTQYEGTSYGHPNALINSAMMKEYSAEKEHEHDYAAADHEHDAIEFPEQQPPVHVGQTPPDDPSEGDLWMLDATDENVADKLFVRVGDAWEPATSLQHERRMRIAEDLIVAEQLSRADSHYMYRLDQIVLPDPLLADKGVMVHDGELPATITDDKIHFKKDVSTGDYLGESAELAFRGDDPGAGIKYAVMHHKKSNSMVLREEWHVKEVSYANGTVRVVASEAFGDSWGSFDTWPCTLWLLTEEQAADVGLGLDLTQQDGDASGVENLTKVGTLRYDRGTFNWGADAKNYYARFSYDNPTVLGLNQYSLEDGTIAWSEVFPVGDTLIIEGAVGSMALRVKDTQTSGTNQRTHNFKTEVLYRTGEFVGEEILTISTGNVTAPKKLLLDDVVVGDSTYEPRITALEDKPDPEGYDDTELREQVEANTAAISNLGGDGPTTPDGEPVIKTITVTGLTKSTGYEDNTFFPKSGSGTNADPYITTKLYVTTESDDPFGLDSRRDIMIHVAIGTALLVREDTGRCVWAGKIAQWRGEGQGRIELTVDLIRGDGSWNNSATYSLVLKDV